MNTSETYNTENTIFISYYSIDGNYPSLKEKLEKSLNKFNLKYSIEKINKFNSWQDGVAYKPRFILTNLLKFRKSVVWLDIDTEIWSFPNLLFKNYDFAIYNWLADNNHHLDGKISYDPNSEKLFCAGGVQKFAYTAPAIELLIRWIEITSSLKEKKNNDPILDLAFNNFKPPLNQLWLPKEYNRMDKHTDHWSSIPENEVIINHDYVGGKHRF